jgi:LacI family transcriptional regulator
VGEGIIARCRDEELAGQIRAMKIPAVNVSLVHLPGVKMPRVITDEREIAQSALTHLLERGIKHFAFCGPSDRVYVRHRGCVFQQIVADAGFECELYPPPNVATARSGWLERRTDLAEWLRGLPKPIGIMTWNAIESRRLVESCRMADLRVPDEVALISVDSDDLISEMVTPSLSGVKLATEKIGFEAAALLHRMMRGEDVGNVTVHVPVEGIAARQSTDVLAVDDPGVRDAVKFIHHHAHQAISVLDVARATGMSRRVLERRFREMLGRSPAQEIRRVHIDRAKELLTQTDLAVSQVAEASGFNHVERLILMFKQATGMTPLVYRKRLQAGRDG